MAPFAVTVVIEGLFVFVNRKTPKALYVLMPDSSTAPMQACHPDSKPPNVHDHPAHKGWITMGGANRKRFADHIDLTGLTGGSEIYKAGLPLSKTTGVAVAKPLLDDALTTAPVKGKVIGRVVLPPPRAITLKSSVGVEWLDNSGKWVDLNRNVSGYVTLDYLAAAPIVVPGFGTIDQAHSEVHLQHVPDGLGVESHETHSCFRHAHMHASIFNGKASHFRTNGPTTKGAARIFALDPVICTSGNGCPPEDPNCPDS